MKTWYYCLIEKYSWLSGDVILWATSIPSPSLLAWFMISELVIGNYEFHSYLMINQTMWLQATHINVVAICIPSDVAIKCRVILTATPPILL